MHIGPTFAPWGSGFLVQFKVTTGGVPVGQDYVHVTISADTVEGVTFHVYDEPHQSIAAAQVANRLTFAHVSSKQSPKSRHCSESNRSMKF